MLRKGEAFWKRYFDRLRQPGHLRANTDDPNVCEAYDSAADSDIDCFIATLRLRPSSDIININDDRYGRHIGGTLLHQAVAQGHRAMTALLLALGADVGA
jgi:hypothetical protein